MVGTQKGYLDKLSNVAAHKPTLIKLRKLLSSTCTSDALLQSLQETWNPIKDLNLQVISDEAAKILSGIQERLDEWLAVAMPEGADGEDLSTL